MKAVAALAFAGALVAGAAQAQDAGLKLGTLTCKATEITKATVFTDVEFDCLYESVNGNTERYEGEIDRIGVDLSIKNDATMVWTVVAPTETEITPGQLAGTHVGARRMSRWASGRVRACWSGAVTWASSSSRSASTASRASAPWTRLAEPPPAAPQSRRASRLQLGEALQEGHLNRLDGPG